MAEPFTPSQKYVEEFNPKDYYKTYYSAGEGSLLGEWTDFALQNFHDIFHSGGVKGDVLLDFGAGPAIYHLLSSCEVFDQIITSDFLEQNRVQLQKWLRKDPDALDWSAVVKAVCKLEGHSDYGKKEEKLRKAVTKILKCDALKKNPYEPEKVPPADCLTSCLCLEVASKDKETYTNILRNLKDLLKPGGHIVIQSVLNCTYYYVGNKRFFCLSLTKEDLERAFKEAGYEIVTLKVHQCLEARNSDYDSIYCVHAQKPAM